MLGSICPPLHFVPLRAGIIWSSKVSIKKSKVTQEVTWVSEGLLRYLAYIFLNSASLEKFHQKLM